MPIPTPEEITKLRSIKKTAIILLTMMYLNKPTGEVELSEILDISRKTIRGYLKSLSAIGLVTRQFGKGGYVLTTLGAQIALPMRPNELKEEMGKSYPFETTTTTTTLISKRSDFTKQMGKNYPLSSSSSNNEMGKSYPLEQQPTENRHRSKLAEGVQRDVFDALKYLGAGDRKAYEISNKHNLDKVRCHIAAFIAEWRHKPSNSLGLLFRRIEDNDHIPPSMYAFYHRSFTEWLRDQSGEMEL